MNGHSSPTRVLIVDHYPIILEGLRFILHGAVGFTLVGEAGTGKSAVILAKTLLPDLLVLDNDLCDLTGLDVLRLLSSTVQQVRVLLLTGRINPLDANEALRLGARGMLAKTAHPQTILKCLRAIAAGEYWIRHEHMGEVIRDLQRSAPYSALTEREHQVVEAILTCKSNRQIALALNISEETVKSHIRNAFEKLHVSSRLELALHYHEQ